MAEIHRMIKEGETIYPATTTDAVVHPQIKATISSLVMEYNVSSLFPTSGQDSGNKYTLDSMIALLSTKLNDSQKVAGVKGSFLDVTTGKLLTYVFNGKTEFSTSSGWSMVIDSEELGKKLGNIVPEIGENGNWFIGGEDTGKPSKGADGVEKAIEDNELIKKIEQKTNNYLYGKILSVTGDSEAAGHTIGVQNTYGNLIAGRNNMTINNYAQNGRKLVTGTESSLVDTYQEISPESDYILVQIGYNDAFDSEQQEVDDNSQDKTTFKGAFNILIQGLQSRYPKARIGFITPYYFIESGSYHKAHAEWIKQRCEYYHIQCLDGTAVSGLRYDCAEQSEYFIDQVHLTALGHERVSYVYEQFLRGL